MKYHTKENPYTVWLWAIMAAAALWAMVMAASGAPYGPALDAVGGYKAVSAQYTIRYHTQNGYFVLKGKVYHNRDGSTTESISGTVTGTTLNGTYTQADFMWLPDVFWMINHYWIAAQSFTLTVTPDGKVTGSCTYKL